jgi:predicted Zn-dependent protease
LTAALRLLEEGMRRIPQDHRLPHLAAFLHDHEDRLEEAARLYEVSANLEPDFSATWLNLGEVLLRLNRIPAALDAFSRIQDTTDSEENRAKGLDVPLKHLFRAQLFTAMVGYADLVRSAVEKRPELCLLVGKGAFLEELYPEAERWFKAAGAPAAKDALVLAMRGQLALAQDRFPDAEKFLKNSLELKETPEVLVQLGGLYLEKFAAPARATPYLERAIALSPQHTLARFQLARALEKLAVPAARERAAWQAYLEIARGKEAPAFIDEAEARLKALAGGSEKP